MPAAVAPSPRHRPAGAGGPPAAGPPASPLLRRLAAERATGAFTRAGGTLFLVDGQVAHAESPAAPGLDVLLTTGGALPGEAWRAALAEAGPRRSVARHLVETGRVPGGVLELCQIGALHDAAFFVLAPGGGPGRFRHGVRHWLGAFRAVPAAAVERETVRRRSLLDRAWTDAGTDTLPVVRTARPPDVRVPARRRPVLDLADGGRTACEIARTLGRPAFHTLIDLRKLAAAGLVAPAVSSAEPPRVPSGPGELPGPPREFDDPDVALLRRLRDALEAL
ncbi:hypothetical protein GCM10009801_20120 [Streptomyces albiaxialis]|uniref:Transcriptional regulator n=1 Tax=Streptomyces albiaxialis TaxID=329523 RepID=A0ABN2VQZ3_9ACTN